MLIHNSAELKAILLPKIKESVRQTQDQVYNLIHKYLLQYYHEFTPEYYYRTQQLLNSLVRSEITETPNGYRAEVYFDLTAMNYTMKKIKVRKYTSKGYIRNNDWDGKREMELAGKGYHSKRPVIRGTAVWDTPKAELDSKLIQMLIANLKANGIPIR